MTIHFNRIKNTKRPAWAGLKTAEGKRAKMIKLQNIFMQ
jgi:hypothetical protein